MLKLDDDEMRSDNGDRGRSLGYLYMKIKLVKLMGVAETGRQVSISIQPVSLTLPC